MSAISDFADAMNEHLGAIETAMSDIAGDVSGLQSKIDALTASLDSISPADQALLDGIKEHAASIAGTLRSIDDMTPPVAPTG